MSKAMTYALIDSGGGEKLEQFGPYTLIRPAPQAVWSPRKPELWKKADSHFIRSQAKGKWSERLPREWEVAFGELKLLVRPTEFGHLGVFPEHVLHWDWMKQQLEKVKQPKVLNLFAYSGAASLACAQFGAQVTHVDSAKGMVDWAKDNAQHNGVSTIRWMVEDALKFVKRELKRDSSYEGILLDPPTFGRGTRGEVFKIEERLPELLDHCCDLLSEQACFFLLTCHTPGFTPLVLKQLVEERLEGKIESGEMVLEGGWSLPSGAFAKWESP